MDSVKNEPRKVKDSIYNHILNSYEAVKLEVVEDIRIMKAQYLIDNIELSFEVWKTQKWAQHLSFDEFCEFILPYKIFEGQILDDWKDFFFTKYNNLLSNLDYASIFSRSSYVACQTVNQALYSELKPKIIFGIDPHILSLKTLLSIPFGTCDEYSLLTTAVMRANGIPVGMDFTPHWPTRNMGHTWNFLHDNQKNDIVFEGVSETIEVHHKKEQIMSKVFRNTYKINTELEKLIMTEEYLPPVFTNPFIEDITIQYMTTMDIERNVNTDNNYVYLATFNNKSWTIVAWGKNKKGQASFKNIGKDVLYLPVIYTRTGPEPVGEPFIITLDNQIREIKTDTLQKQSLKLDRKYPLLRKDAFTMNMRKVGSKIQAANKEDFSDSVTFHVFSDLEKNININSHQKKYRYWRVLSSPKGHSNIAELLFFDKHNTQLIGKIIGTNGAYKNIDERKKESAFDGDLLTYFDAPQRSGGWVGMAFKDAVAVNRVACVMRGDGNDIEVGNEYELFYWMNGKWVSLGEKIANDVFLAYEDSPKHALFLLRNNTKGEEERIFTYENGNQIWW